MPCEQKRFTVYNFGSINIDHIYRVPHLVKPGETLASREFSQVLGGKGANQSLALARAGGRVCHWGRVSHSDDWALAPLRDANVDITGIDLTDDISGHAIIQVDDDAENAIILHPGANHGFSDEHVRRLVAGASDSGWLLMQNECNNARRLIELASSRGLSIAFNPAPLSVEVAALPLERCQLLFLNRGEAAALVEQEESAPADGLLDALRERLPEVEIVLTLGADGVCYQSGALRIVASAHRVVALDTTAAGDTFIGYFMAARQRGEEIEPSLRLASAASALCVQQAGAAPSIPVDRDVQAALETLEPLTVTHNPAV